MQELAAQMLLKQAGHDKPSQNQNAGFCGWFMLAIVLQNSLQSSRELVKGNGG